MSVANPARYTPVSWWRAFWITNVILLVITWYAVGVWPKSELLRVLHLGIETNPATWWSATQLFLAALLLRSVATSIVERDRAAARACTILALVSLALYADELGSLHERLGMFFALKHYREAPFALPIGGAVAYSLLVLERRRFLVGSTARLVAAGFACFVLAGAQELLENRFVAERWMDAFRTVIEEGSELAGTFLFLVAGIRARRTASEEPLGSIADWRSLGWVVLLALLCTAPVLFFRSQWTFDQLRIPKLGDFGVVIPVAAFSCAAGAAALQARSKRQPVGAWWRLAAVLVGLSIAAETHLHRYLLGYVSWRYDLDLIAGLPFLAWALLGIPELRRRSVYLGLFVLAVSVLLSVFKAGSPMLSLVNIHFAALGSATAVLLAGPVPVRQLSTVSRRTVVVPATTIRTR